MHFNSPYFYVYALMVVSFFFLLPGKRGKQILFFASLYFYFCFAPVYLLLIVSVIFITYYAAIIIDRSIEKRKRLVFFFAIASYVLFLAFFKYYTFIQENVVGFGKLLSIDIPMPILHILLPMGISFYIFQSIAYIIDVHRGDYPACEDFWVVANYVAFFPQIIAGPIERPGSLMEQFKTDNAFEYSHVIAGGKRIIIGLIQKVVIADNLAVYIDTVFPNMHQHTGAQILIAVYLYSLQIYFDFAGYSGIAIGTARLFGISIRENFNNPYIANSIPDFWKRWHISLTSWFRDYLFIGLEYFFAFLGFDKISKKRMLLNVFLVFVVSGVWHGASWTFIAWGALQGFYMVMSSLTQAFRQRILRYFKLTPDLWISRAISILVTFHLITFSWILFRASSFSEFADVLVRVSQIVKEPLVSPKLNYEMLFAFLGFVLLGFRNFSSRFPLTQCTACRMLFYVTALVIVYIFGNFTSNTFIYFRF